MRSVPERASSSSQWERLSCVQASNRTHSAASPVRRTRCRLSRTTKGSSAYRCATSCTLDWPDASTHQVLRPANGTLDCSPSSTTTGVKVLPGVCAPKAQPDDDSASQTRQASRKNQAPRGLERGVLEVRGTWSGFGMPGLWRAAGSGQRAKLA
ncbi:hypothetical protein FQZ97_839690 [compost metagenome]